MNLKCQKCDLIALKPILSISSCIYDYFHGQEINENYHKWVLSMKNEEGTDLVKLSASIVSFLLSKICQLLAAP